MTTLMIALFACGAAPEQGQDAPAAPAAPATPGAPNGSQLAVIVDSHTQTGEGLATSATALSSVASGSRVDLQIEHLVSYCAPTPSFKAETDGEVLRVRMQALEGVSRCFGTHRIAAHLDLPEGASVQRVALHAPDGKPLAESPLATN